MLIAVLIAVATAWQSSSVRAQQADPQWSRPIDVTEPSGADLHTFPVLQCDQHQNAYVLWADLADEGAAIFLRNDQTGTWSEPVDVIATPFPVVFGLNGAISNQDNTLHLIWINAYIGGDLYYSQSLLSETGNHKGWSDPLALAYGVDWATIGTDSKGSIHVLYGSTDATRLEPTVYHIKSSDGGRTWTDPIAVYTAAPPVPAIVRPEVAIDGRDRIHVGITTNSDDYGAYSEVGYIQSTDGGATWSPYKQIQRGGSSFQGVAWISPYAFGADEVHLTWHDPRRMHTWSSDGGNTWRRSEEIMQLGAAFGGRNQLVKDSAGSLHVVAAVADGVYSASWNGTQWSAPEQIDNRYIDPHGQTIIACQGNQLHVAYYDRTGDNKVWYATRKINTPHIDREPIPAPSQDVTAVSATGAISVATSLNNEPLLPPELVAAGEGGMNPMISAPLLPVMIPAAAVVMLIAGMVALRRWRSAR